MVFLHKAVATVNLYRLNRVLHRYFRSVKLGHSAGLVVVHAVVFEPCGAVYHHFCCFNIGSHLRQLKGNSLVLTNGLAKSFAFLRVSQGQFVGTASNTQCLSRNTDPATREGLHRELKAKAIFANAVFFWHFHIRVHDGVRIRRTDTELVFFSAYGYAVPAGFYDESIDATVLQLRIGLSNHQMNAGRTTIGNPVLGTV